MIHFDELKDRVIELLCQSNVISMHKTTRFFVVRNVYGRISIYIDCSFAEAENRPDSSSMEQLTDILVQEVGKEWIDSVIDITDNRTIIEQLSETSVLINNGVTTAAQIENLYFGERHLTRLNWFHKGKKSTSMRKAKVVTFYSFKGGLGRTTSMVMTALHLARLGKNVVLIDFDLEAPGLSSLLPPENDDMPSYGLIDYLLESNIYTNSKVSLDIDSYVYSFKDRTLTGNNGGQIYIVPASRLTPSASESYLEKMGRVDFGTPNYQKADNPITRLLDQLEKRFHPDFIFLDARTGINDVGGLTLTTYTDLACVLSYGNEQNMAGLRIVLPKIIEANVPFILLNSPVPIVEEEGKEELEYYLEHVYTLLQDIGYYDCAALPDLYDETVEHYPINIYYDNFAVLLNSNYKIRKLLDLPGGSNNYEALSQQIASLFGEHTKEEPVHFPEERKDILEGIIGISRVGASEDEFINEEDLLHKFYPLPEHRFIFDSEKFLILGTKGSGKTALFSVLEHPQYLENLASYVGLTTNSIKSTSWITGMKNKPKATEEYPTALNFQQLASENDEHIFRRYWLLLALRSIHARMSTDIPPISESLQLVLSASKYELRHLAKDSALAEKLEQYFGELDHYLQQNVQKITIIYDGLDAILQDKQLRGKMISSLISLWYEYVSLFSNIRAKIFLREDIFRNEVHVTDKVKINNFSEQLSWDYDSLLAMTYKRIVETSPLLANRFNEALQPLGLTIPKDGRVGYMPKADENINRTLLKILFGERMGTGKAAFTYNWIRNHLSDTKDQIAPRSMVTLFAKAAQRERDEQSDNTAVMTFPLIRNRNLQSVLGEVSQLRVDDLLEEYEEYTNIFRNLKNVLPSFPANEDELKDALRNCGVPLHSEQTMIDELVNIGVMKSYQRKKNNPVRYHIPDIFLIGLGLTRRGLRK